MNRLNIITSLQSYLKNNPKFEFYQKSIEYFRSLPENIILKISKKIQSVEGIRIHLCYNLEKYHVYLYKKKKKGISYLRLKLDDVVIEKLLFQLVILKENNNVISLGRKDVTLPKLSPSRKHDLNYLYVIISENKLKFNDEVFELGNLYESLGYVLGKEIFNILKYQRLDRIQNFINSKEESYDIYKLLSDFSDYIKRFDWQYRERLVIHSGAFFQTVGTTYTRDLDVLILQEMKPVSEVRTILAKFTKEMKLDVDPSVLVNDENWYTKDEKTLPYKKLWLSTVWPSLVGAKNMYEVICNPTFYFQFMGIKFVSMDMNINRFLSRSNQSIVDLIMLEELNGVKLGAKLCIPNMTIRQGNVEIFDEKKINKLYLSIHDKLKKYYSRNMSIGDIKKRISKCSEKLFDIYKGEVIKDLDTALVKIYNQKVKFENYKKYATGAENLLDIGSGRLTDLRFWNSVGIKNAVCIEPSIHSIKKAYEQLNKFGSKTNITIVNGSGDIVWKNDDKYHDVINKKYDVCSFQFSIHYLMNDINILINNIVPLLHNNSKIIITCMDGNKIHRDIRQSKNGRIEIRNNFEPLFVIYPYYDFSKFVIPDKPDILVYLKGSYGVSAGSVERLIDVDKLIQLFKKYNLNLVERTNFLDYNIKIKRQMNYNQKKISSYYISLIFDYKN